MPVSKLRSILVATDLTPACDPAIAAAGDLAAACGAALHALHVHDFSAEAPGLSGVDGFPGRLAAMERALLAQLRRALPAGVTPASASVMIYSVPFAVADYARGMGADLIVMGPHRPRALLDRLRRCTAEQVMRRARLPCLVVPRPLRLPLQRVLVGVDPSGASRGAVQMALGWGTLPGVAPDEEGGAEVHLVHVSPDAHPGDPDARLDPLLASAQGGAASVRVRGDIVPGEDPAAWIAHLARKRDAGLVVVGARCRGGVARLLAGSVSTGVLREATTPVLLVPHDPRGARAAARPSVFYEGILPGRNLQGARG